MDTDIKEQFAATHKFIQHVVDSAEERLGGRISRLEMTVVEFNERMATRIENRLLARVDDVQNQLIARMDEGDARVIKAIALLLTRTDNRLSRIEQRFSKMDKRFTQMDNRLSRMEKRRSPR